MCNVPPIRTQTTGTVTYREESIMADKIDVEVEVVEAPETEAAQPLSVTVTESPSIEVKVEEAKPDDEGKDED